MNWLDPHQWPAVIRFMILLLAVMSAVCSIYMLGRGWAWHRRTKEDARRVLIPTEAEMLFYGKKGDGDDTQSAIYREYLAPLQKGSSYEARRTER